MYPSLTKLVIVVTMITGSAHADTLLIGGTGMTLGLVQALKGPFERLSPNDQLVVIPGLGSGAGIAALADSALDIAVSGRQLKDREKATKLKIHPFIETPFVFVSNTSTVLDLTVDDLIDIFSGEKVYLADGLRARIILRPEGDSVTGFLGREIDGMEGALSRARSFSGVPVAQTDQENMGLAQKMSGAVTAMTMTQTRTEPNTLKLIKVDGVDPDPAVKGSDQYPYRTNAWIVTREKVSPVVQRFLDFLDTPEALDTYSSSGAARIK